MTMLMVHFQQHPVSDLDSAIGSSPRLGWNSLSFNSQTRPSGLPDITPPDHNCLGPDCPICKNSRDPSTMGSLLTAGVHSKHSAVELKFVPATFNSAKFLGGIVFHSHSLIDFVNCPRACRRSNSP
uniref:Uncharacterized protein n=1 Tax=Physcomitrium patens TaxID=3218 RepID=A9TNS2_PHYPA|nr:hypothetical protein PHYPA_026701 [Physcomitrium patens]